MNGACRADAAEAVRVLFWDTRCAVVGVVAPVMRLRRELMSAIRDAAKHVKSRTPICGLLSSSSALLDGTQKLAAFSHNQFGGWLRPVLYKISTKACAGRVKAPPRDREAFSHLWA